MTETPLAPVETMKGTHLRPPPPLGWHYAGFSLRAFALTIDQILLLLITVIVALPASILIFLGQMAAWPFTAFFILPSGPMILILISWAYFALQEASHHRATFGKRLCGLSVTDLSGNRITLTRSTVRFFGKFVSCAIMLIGFFMAAFTERHQALHDILAETLVLKRAKR